jgi:hypothetical protein
MQVAFLILSQGFALLPKLGPIGSGYPANAQYQQNQKVQKGGNLSFHKEPTITALFFASSVTPPNTPKNSVYLAENIPVERHLEFRYWQVKVAFSACEYFIFRFIG